MTELIRIGVVGLGNMGRHHARVVSRLEGFELVGGADPAGDPHRALGRFPLFPSLEDLLDAGADAVVLAIPPSSHEKAALMLADAGVHALIEKPLADTLEGALTIRDAFAETPLVAGVGHVERFNPALQEMKRRLDIGAVGRILSIATRRAGPYPLRSSEVGVVHDLASHDIDIIRWLGGPVGSMQACLGHHLDHGHEDLVEAIGRLESGAVVSMSVNWITPSKDRRVTVLGERGALVADLLTSDITFYSNSAIPVEWEEMARLKGVAEGDVIRFAIRKVEPLQLELEGFRDVLRGTEGGQIVTLDEGVEVMRLAAALLKGATSL